MEDRGWKSTRLPKNFGEENESLYIYRERHVNLHGMTLDRASIILTLGFGSEKAGEK